MKQSPPTTEPARTEWVKFQLRLRGLSMADVARGLDLERSTARKVFERRYPAVEARIARILGSKAADIWPERYRDGKPVRLRGGPRSRKKCPHAGTDTTQRNERKPSSTPRRPTRKNAAGGNDTENA